jgi:hypothetical protein
MNKLLSTFLLILILINPLLIREMLGEETNQETIIPGENRRD